MKLLFDQNLSPRLIGLVADLFPESNHVFPLGLALTDDRVVRHYALQEHFTIVTKDTDFSDLCFWLGFPPKVIWIRRGNCTTATIATILRENVQHIYHLIQEPSMDVLTLF